MKTIRNKTLKPLRITFSGGKVLPLGPAKTAQIPDRAIEVLDGQGPARDAADTRAAPHEAPRGHRPAMSAPTKGNRGA